METINKVLSFIVIAVFLTSCSLTQPGSSSDTPLTTQAGAKSVLSPFALFESIKKSEGIAFDRSQVDNVLKSYDIYDKIAEEIAETEFIESDYSDVAISGFSFGNKKVAIMLLRKGHLYIYIMFSNGEDKWKFDGFAYHNERFEPEYRVENSGDGEKYWLVVRHESNHGTGLQIHDEIWYNPDGSVAAQYPVEGSSEFFPQNIEPAAYANFTAYADYDGKSTISISYSVNFEYGYKESFNNRSYAYKFKSDYSPAIREYWNYDLQTQQLNFVSCSPDLHEGFSTLEHEVSPAFGMLQGYIDFYRIKLGDRKITTLGEWESFIGQNE